MRGLTPTQAALLLVPMALITGALAPDGRQARSTACIPRYSPPPGLLLWPVALFWLSR